MKRTLLLLSVGVLLLASMGCAGPMPTAGVVPPPGYILTDVRAPLSSNNQGIAVGGSKTGIAQVKQYIWIVSAGDCSIEAAAKDAGITKINYVDYEYFTVLSGIFSRFAIIVHGD